MHIDFTKGNITKQIILFSAPIILGNIFMQLYHYVDIVIVGRFLGKQELAAVGASAPFTFMLISIVIGVSMGTTITISQYFGLKDYKSIKKSADSLYVFLFFAYIIIFIFGVTFSKQILLFIDLPVELLPIATQYLDIYMIGLIFLFGFNSLSAILRGVGDSLTSLKFLAISAIINIILDILFVVVFEWGIEGVAWATVIAQAISFFFAINYTNRKSPIIKLNLLKLDFDRRIFLESVKLGIPAGIQQFFVSFGMLAVFAIVNSYGIDVIAAFSAAGRIESVIFIIPMGLSLSMTSFVAQNYSVGNFDRIKKGLNSTIRMSLISSFVFLIVLSLLAEPLMKMFTSEPNIINIGCEYLYIFGISYWIFSIMFCYMGVLRGMKNTIIPMFITLLSLWVVKIPIAHLLSNLFGVVGIWSSSVVSWSVGMALSIIYFNYFFKKQVRSFSEKQVKEGSKN